MTRDIKWLKEEINKLESEPSQRYPHDETVWACEVLELVDEVKQSGLPVVPSYVAEVIEHYKKIGGTIHQVTGLNSVLFKHDFPEVYKNNTRELQELIARAWLEGYTVSDEPKYRVVVKVGKDEGVFFLAKDSNDKIQLGTSESEIDMTAEELLLTEKEIKDYNESFWQFVD